MGFQFQFKLNTSLRILTFLIRELNKDTLCEDRSEKGKPLGLQYSGISNRRGKKLSSLPLLQEYRAIIRGQTDTELGEEKCLLRLQP